MHNISISLKPRGEIYMNSKTDENEIILSEDEGYTKRQKAARRNYRSIERMTEVSREIDSLGKMNVFMKSLLIICDHRTLLYLLVLIFYGWDYCFSYRDAPSDTLIMKH